MDGMVASYAYNGAATLVDGSRVSAARAEDSNALHSILIDCIRVLRDCSPGLKEERDVLDVQKYEVRITGSCYLLYVSPSVHIARYN